MIDVQTYGIAYFVEMIESRRASTETQTGPLVESPLTGEWPLSNFQELFRAVCVWEAAPNLISD